MSDELILRRHADSVRTMRYWLLGREFYVALAAMEFAASIHVGVRKDGVSPEFSHQIYQANYVKTILPSLVHQQETLATVFLHDVCEDYGVGFEEIASRFGTGIERSVRLMTKKFRGTVIPPETYYAAMAEDPVASIAKAADRGHNILTMDAAGWTSAKQASYLDEMEQRILPMMKAARRRFPEQEPAYENAKTLLRVQAALIRLSLAREREYKSGQAQAEMAAARTF